MGQIHEQHGKIAVETRGDHSFIIHAGYGFKTGRRKLGDLKPGTIFLARDPEVRWEPGGIGLPNDPPERVAWRLRAIFEDRVEAESEQFSTHRSFDPDRMVEVPGTEDFDETEPLAKRWNGDGAYPHPEFARDDLDDLIAALEEVRDS